MTNSQKTYCLDANVLIQAWQKYYAPRFCPTYWEVLNTLGKRGVIFLPELVYEEIVRTEDDLSKWVKSSDIEIRKMDESVTFCLKHIFDANPIHKHLVDNIRGRSQADPWVIAHAIKENAIVVTKEKKITAASSKRIRIPNVCDNMGIKCIDDFQMITELGLTFSCTIGK